METEKTGNDTVSQKVLQLSVISKNNVVILGSRFYKGEIIKRIAAKVFEHKLMPIIAFDITQNIEEHITPRQRMNWFLATSRFVLAEDSVPSGEIIELEYCRNLGVTTAILHDTNLPRSSWMTLDSDIHCNDFKCFCYDKNNVEQTVELAIKWAKERNEDKERNFEKTQED